ncbi:MAG: DUF559 domain-containing protein [Rhizomicrobium sp.]
MFKPAGPEKIARGRQLRREATGPERRLWRALRELNRQGYHFRRQAPFDCYILDFVEHSAKVTIELDGSQHGLAGRHAQDARRDAFLESQGYLTLRFWNSALAENFEGVVEAIFRAVTDRVAHSASRVPPE